ncbi:MAG: radical SAM family heme chaperone HemW [Bilophila sp.]
MLLYIHVPFCRRKCRYCAFHSEPQMGEEPAESALRMRAYMDVLMLELAQWADRLGKQPVETVFFGGGTPSLLPPRSVGTILERVRRCFKLSPGAEITLEANPESLNTRGLVRDYMRVGVNRISLGIQSLDDDMLTLLGRMHRASGAITAYRAVRDAYCPNVSVDLMWGLPGQKLRHWRQTLKEVIGLRPDHLSAYGLTLEPGTPLDSDCESGLLTLPPEREQASMYIQGAELLEEAGLMQYEVSNFARMGYQCRHNLGYWEGQDYLGLGPAATSTFAGRRWTNPPDLSLWGRQVTAKRISDDLETLDTVTRVLELMMLRLRTTRGLRIRAYKDLTGRDFMKDHKKFIHALHKNGLIRILNGYLSLTRSGMLVSNSILGNLFETAHTLLDTPALVKD